MPANLKNDLKNKLLNDKFYDELELVRLAGDPNTYYKGKIKKMSKKLAKIAVVNTQLGLVEQYFQDDASSSNAPIPSQPANVIHPGQTHGE